MLGVRYIGPSLGWNFELSLFGGRVPRGGPID